MREAQQCEFDLAWIGQCKNDAVSGGYCLAHEGLKCVSCGSQATRECNHTGTQFVCGFPLCGGCEHGDVPSGSLLGLGGGHRKKAKGGADGE